jgi:hypothetical protein
LRFSAESHRAFTLQSENEWQIGSQIREIFSVLELHGLRSVKTSGKFTLLSRTLALRFGQRPQWVTGKACKMCAASAESVSKLLVKWGQGDLEAREALIPFVYDELRRVARRHLGLERPDHTLESAALVHEAYVRLVDKEPPQWQNRAHFFGVAAQLMRHLLVDHARNRRAAKRGAGTLLLTLNEQIALPRKKGKWTLRHWMMP